MKTRASFKNELAALQRAWTEGDPAQALARANQMLEQWPDNPHLLVLWASLVQMQDEPQPHSLKDVLRALKRATELAPKSPEVWIELGHYYSAVADDARQAKKCFARAITSSMRLLREAVLGQIETTTELDERQQARKLLAFAYILTQNETLERSSKNSTDRESPRAGDSLDELLAKIRITELS